MENSEGKVGYERIIFTKRPSCFNVDDNIDNRWNLFHLIEYCSTDIDIIQRLTCNGVDTAILRIELYEMKGKVAAHWFLEWLTLHLTHTQPDTHDESIRAEAIFMNIDRTGLNVIDATYLRRITPVAPAPGLIYIPPKKSEKQSLVKAILQFYVELEKTEEVLEDARNILRSNLARNYGLSFDKLPVHDVAEKNKLAGDMDKVTPILWGNP